MRASVIVLAFGHCDLTRICVEAIQRNTAPPYELVLVDNGSTDGRATARYFESINGATIVRLKRNAGFAGGLNQGLRRATGDYVAFVSNDCVVTPGWLSRLIAVAESDPTIGLVGPITNYASGIQGVPITTEYRSDDTPSLDRFAATVAETFAGQVIDVSRLVFFSVLITRRCLDVVGLLDERFHNSHEDDDHVRRARLAGFRAVVDCSTFVHHVGSVTVAEAGWAEYAATMERNRKVYEAKWGGAM